MRRFNILCIFSLLYFNQLTVTHGQAQVTNSLLSGGAICESGMSICSTTSTMCIADDKFCDDHVDCDDGMDEVGCYPPSLPRLSKPAASFVDPRTGDARSVEIGSFMCEDKRCIPLASVCNGIRDCVGGRDEQGCKISTPRPAYDSSFDDLSRSPSPVYQTTYPSGWTSYREASEMTPESVQVKIEIYDPTQEVSAGNDVVFRCRDESTLRVPVYWSRSGMTSDRRLPSNAYEDRGRLSITKVTNENEGVYYCHADGYPDRKTAQLIILRGGRYSQGGTSYSRGGGGGGGNSSPDSTTRSSSGSWGEVTRSSNTLPSRPSTDLYSQSVITQSSVQSSSTVSRLASLQRAKKMRDCQPGYISCSDGSICISRRQMCDNRVDCLDTSDEKGCRKNCTNQRFTCGEQCLDKTKRCDGVVDCADGADEFLCQNECGLSSFWCPNSQECIPQVYRCDGEYDCSNGADEKDCAKPRMLEQPQKLYTVERGKSITLTCRASGIPKPKIEWRFNLQRIPDSASSSISVCTTCHNCADNESLSSLTVNQFDERFEGKWTCEAVNSLDHELAPHDTELTLRPASPYVSGRVY